MSHLVLKDVLGPVVSVIAAGASAFFSHRSHEHSRSTDRRNLFIEGQRQLLEINKLLVNEPLLWSLVDVNPVRLTEQFKAVEGDPFFVQKVRAFAHIILTMFELILSEAPDPKPGDPLDTSNAWLRFYLGVIAGSAVVRTVLEEENRTDAFFPRCKLFYDYWRAHAAEPGMPKETTPQPVTTPAGN